MNLLYLHAHDLGRWIEPYGYEVATPNLSALASRSGTNLFLDAHSAAPTCSPSRAALLTGMTPHESGMMGLMHRGFRLKDPNRHLAFWLQQNGFKTALAGIQHLQPGAELSGYDFRFNPVKSTTQQGQIDWPAWDGAVADEAARFLEARKEKDGTFFLDCGFWLPHRPFPPGEADGSAPPPGVADTPETRRDMAEFLAAVRHLDDCCGRVLSALDRAGLTEDTLILFTTDHGPAFPGYKCRLTDGGTGVAMMIRPPGQGSRAARRIDSLVSQLDVFPTICDYLGVELPPWTLRGRSLRGLMEGATGGAESAVFSEVTYHAGYEPMRAVRTADHVLIRLFEEDLRPVPANVDDSAAKEAWIRDGGLDRLREPVQLFDRKRDPLGQVDLAEDG
ncbi:MAG: sulfatase, partial [Verrucomicrobiae bacterium]|nr:sulfatase [Verrucomicrobiae bacterium]